MVRVRMNCHLHEAEFGQQHDYCGKRLRWGVFGRIDGDGGFEEAGAGV